MTPPSSNVLFLSCCLSFARVHFPCLRCQFSLTMNSYNTSKLCFHRCFLIKKPVFLYSTGLEPFTFVYISRGSFSRLNLHRTQSVPTKVKWEFSEIVLRLSSPPVSVFFQGRYPQQVLSHRIVRGSLYQLYRAHGPLASSPLPALPP